MPHTLVVKIRGTGAVPAAAQEEGEGELEGAAVVDAEDAFITLRTDADLQRAFAAAEAAGQLVQASSPSPGLLSFITVFEWVRMSEYPLTNMEPHAPAPVTHTAVHQNGQDGGGRHGPRVPGGDA